MKYALPLFARYNAHVNRLLYDLLADVDADLLSESRGAYFGSVIGILNHILTSWLGWLVRFRDGGVSARSLESPALAHKHPGFGKVLHAGLPELREHQLLMDETLFRLVGELCGPGGDPMQVFAFVNTKGEAHRHRVGEILLHVFNHATHHRGQISQILDEAGVEHDFSGLMALFEEPES